MSAVVLFAGAVAAADPLAARLKGRPPAQVPSIHQRQTSVMATISGSPKRNDGVYIRTGTSGICGEIPKDASLTGTATFVIEFPSDVSGPDAPGSVLSVTFGSQQLVGSATSASAFRLSVSVFSQQGARPPAYVLNTDARGAKSAGTATRTDKGNVTTLSVTGQNETGENIDLTVICR